MMRTLVRYVLAFLAFMAVWLIGAALGIHPTIAEGLLVVFSLMAAGWVHEAAS